LAHRLGGSTVCITDGDTDALVHLRENLNQNKDDKNAVSAHQLIWGQETSEVFQKRHGTFDVLLASDIIYARCIVEPLWETIRLLLSRSTTSKFIMAYFARREVNVTIEFVLSYAEGAGFTYELVEEDPEGVRIFVFQWKPEEIREP
jgi:Lysine methyltransferase